MNRLMIIAASIAAAYLTPAAFAAEPETNPAGAVAKVDAERFEVITQARNAFPAHLAAWSSEGAGTTSYLDPVADDAVFEYRLVRQGVTLKIEGKAAIAEHLQDLAALATDWRFSNILYFPTLDPNIVFVQYDATAKLAATGEEVRQKHIAEVEMKGGQIAGLREFSQGRLTLDTLLAGAAAQGGLN